MKLTDIQKMIKDFESSNLTELNLEFEETKLKLSKQTHIQNHPIQTSMAQVLAPVETETKVTKDAPKNPINSPLVGTYYAASSPQSKPFVEVGKQVKKGDVLCLIEAMKIMNEITAPKDGVIIKIHAMNGQVVGMEDPLFEME